MLPNVLLALAIRERVFETLFDAFHETLAAFGDDVPPDLKEVDGSRHDRTRHRILKSLRALGEDEQLDFLAQYKHLVARKEPYFVERAREAYSVANEIFGERFGYLSDTGCEFGHFCDEDYQAVAAQSLGILRVDQYLVTPVIYWTLSPWRPVGRLPEIEALLRAALRKRREMAITEIVKLMEERGLEVSQSLVASMALCDPTLTLSGARPPTIQVAPGEVKRLDLVAHNTNRDQYVTVSRVFVLNEARESRLEVVSPVRFRHEFLSRTVLQGRNQDYPPGLLAVKLLQRSSLGDSVVQGLSAALYKEIVRCLEDSKRAMSKEELEATIGLTVPLAPETLPPGRLMAYAPGARFLHEDRAFYVLKEWVETDTEKRARILRNRIVTPFRVKNIEFADDLLNQILNEDLLYARFGIVVSPHVARVVATKLPDNPTELYYLTEIQKRIETAVSKRMTPIGRSAFVPLSKTLERGEGETADAWRKRVLARVIGVRVEQLPDGLEHFEAPISTRLRELFRGQVH